MSGGTRVEIVDYRRGDIDKSGLAIQVKINESIFRGRSELAAAQICRILRKLKIMAVVEESKVSEISRAR